MAGASEIEARLTEAEQTRCRLCLNTDKAGLTRLWAHVEEAFFNAKDGCDSKAMELCYVWR